MNQFGATLAAVSLWIGFHGSALAGSDCRERLGTHSYSCTLGYEQDGSSATSTFTGVVSTDGAGLLLTTSGLGAAGPFACQCQGGGKPERIDLRSSSVVTCLDSASDQILIGKPSGNGSKIRGQYFASEGAGLASGIFECASTD
jgi:hypothetical protein